VERLDEPTRTCEGLPSAAAIDVFSKKVVAGVRREMLCVPTGASITDLQNLEKASYAFWRQDTRKITPPLQRIGQIIRLRGQDQ
jgi:hypothetical protein